jgi:hypothetical protein
MAFIGKSDTDKIQADLKRVITSKLLDGFTNRKAQLVIKTESIIIDYKIDENKSDRDNIFIGPIQALATVWVNLRNDQGQTNDQIQLRINSVQFSFDNDTKEYEIVDGDNVELINNLSSIINTKLIDCYLVIHI